MYDNIKQLKLEFGYFFMIYYHKKKPDTMYQTYYL